jgi:DNA-binding MarR family transcriptional regulator
MGAALTQQQALELWRTVTVQAVRSDEPDLTTRQLAVLMTITLNAPPHTVRGLALALRIAKPAVTRAIDALERFGLAVRVPDEDDARSVLVMRTARGQLFLAGLAGALMQRAADLAAPALGSSISN